MKLRTRQQVQLLQILQLEPRWVLPLKLKVIHRIAELGRICPPQPNHDVVDSQLARILQRLHLANVLGETIPISSDLFNLNLAFNEVWLALRDVELRFCYFLLSLVQLLLKHLKSFEVSGVRMLIVKGLPHQSVKISLESVPLNLRLHEPLPQFLIFRARRLHSSLLCHQMGLFLL